MIFSPVLGDTLQHRFHIPILDQQAHAAGQLPLNGPGGRGNAVFQIMLAQQIPQSQTLFVILKQDVPPNVRIRH